ncbi:protein trichome birefringence-like 13 [Canna indica]|uniref:Protein trichome birefringence-like 13 n=1 Tax=Canna indica TaxID=4628 RepID=A0AAQ3KK68_9LILI|nr:protein trichome birefringence-like 13 [Canna indica]
MAAKGTTRRHSFSSSAASTTSSCLAASLCLASLLIIVLLFSAARPTVLPKYYRTAPQFDGRHDSSPARLENRLSCNYSDGAWVLDPDPIAPRYDHTCKEIFKGWNCIANQKTNGRDLLRWRWQPSHCGLARLDPLRFLRRFRNSNIGFVGDSLNRNMFVSLVCMLRSVSSEVRKWRPAGADRGFTFLDYNLTIVYHRTNLLVRYGSWSASDPGGALESLGYKQGYRVDVDVPEHTWADAPGFHHILIFNTGHWWWAPSKFDPVKSPMLFFEKGSPILPPITPEVGIDVALKNMVSYVEKTASIGATKFFRTQSPRHFEGGDWNEGGSCRLKKPLQSNEVEEFFSVEKNATNAEVRVINKHLYKSLQGSSFRILDITRMSEFRADAHPSTTGGKKHEDCMHWCLPGLTDTWNDILMTSLEDAGS